MMMIFIHSFEMPQMNGSEIWAYLWLQYANIFISWSLKTHFTATIALIDWETTNAIIVINVGHQISMNIVFLMYDIDVPWILYFTIKSQLGDNVCMWKPFIMCQCACGNYYLVICPPQMYCVIALLACTHGNWWTAH